MQPWTGVALAPLAPGDDEMASHYSTYLHPLAGRPLCWHVLAAFAQAVPPPAASVLAGGAEMNPEGFADLVVRQGVVPLDAVALRAAVPAERPALFVDAAAVLPVPELEQLIGSSSPIVLTSAGGIPVAAWVPRAGDVLASGEGGVEAIAHALAGSAELRPAAGSVLVRDRASLAHATVLVRDRLVRRMMAGGVTVMLPETVIVDVDVRVGRDTVLYPGVILEGQTSVGDETVIGPGCRVVDSWIGSGVELKGWNFVAHTSVRNRAVLEPYVRRGFD
jgi:bifunctional N-acetylglucosamine-1-phosphate-uridyltransferase/glucosamine-1-phosphate-acetyltransferase GlmU-like protein